MELLVNELCLRRLCMRTDTDIELVKSGSIKTLFPELGHSKHCACIYKKKGSAFKILSVGLNLYNNSWGYGTTHAEIDAINKLPPRPNYKKNLKRVNILVIKTSSCGEVTISKPCIKCVINMMTLPQKRGYIIKNVSYSNFNGSIIIKPLKYFTDDDEKIYVSKFYKSRNFKHHLIK